MPTTTERVNKNQQRKDRYAQIIEQYGENQGMLVQQLLDTEERIQQLEEDNRILLGNRALHEDMIDNYIKDLRKRDGQLHECEIVIAQAHGDAAGKYIMRGILHAS